MNTKISLEDKKNFIDWFIRNHKTKKRDSESLLSLIIGNDTLLDNLHFVNKNKNYSNYLFISANGSEGKSLFYNEVDEETSISDFPLIMQKIRTKLNEKLYININFVDRIKSPEYAMVSSAEADDDLEEDTIREADLITKEIEEIFRMKNLLKSIDDALDMKDKKLFKLLTKEFNKNTTH